jgi:hypothetical protein
MPVVVSVLLSRRSLIRSRAVLHLEILPLRHPAPGPGTLAWTAPPPHDGRSAPLGLVLPGLDPVAAGARPRATGDRPRVAPARLPVLDLDEPMPHGPADRASRGLRVDPQDVARESALGRASTGCTTATTAWPRSPDSPSSSPHTAPPPQRDAECARTPAVRGHERAERRPAVYRSGFDRLC